MEVSMITENQNRPAVFLKIHVLHLSQPVLVPYICTHPLSSPYQADHLSCFIES